MGDHARLESSQVLERLVLEHDRCMLIAVVDTQQRRNKLVARTPVRMA